jgi:pilus assembly protein Flp/PilA
MWRDRDGNIDPYSFRVLRNPPQSKSETANPKQERPMNNLLNVTKRFVANEDGAALVEYTVLIGIMLVAVIAAIIAIGGWVNTKWTALNAALNG